MTTMTEVEAVHGYAQGRGFRLLAAVEPQGFAVEVYEGQQGSSVAVTYTEGFGTVTQTNRLDPGQDPRPASIRSFKTLVDLLEVFDE